MVHKLCRATNIKVILRGYRISLHSIRNVRPPLKWYHLLMYDGLILQTGTHHLLATHFNTWCHSLLQKPYRLLRVLSITEHRLPSLPMLSSFRLLTSTPRSDQNSGSIAPSKMCRHFSWKRYLARRNTTTIMSHGIPALPSSTRRHICQARTGHHPSCLM